MQDLFVYGTLRRGCKLHHNMARLGAKFLETGKIAAELFPVGQYVGARPARKPGKWVRGELFELRCPASDLRVLDRVEGYFPSAPERSAFVRGTVEVVLTGGARRQAWIYWGRGRHSTGVMHG